MNNRSGKDNMRRLFGVLYHYVVFFLVICFILTCCMTLFLNTMSQEAGIVIERGNISAAARVTFVNVVSLSLLFSAADAVRRRIMVDRPVKRITDAAEKIMSGDLGARIEKSKLVDPNSGLNTVIDYFNKMAEELSGMETLRTDFAASVSHELKTPLAVIQNYGTLLQQPGLSEEKRAEYAKAVTGAARGLADTVSNILKLNKLENQNIFPDAREYDLGEQLCECLLGFEEIWEEKNIELDADIQEGVTITADPELLSLVWNNLFSNAFKFTGSGGRVSVVMRASESEAVAEVSDTGCGISRSEGKRIFEKFYQGDTSHASKGNGLGLALVKRVMDITGAEISVSSEVGKGSVFTVKLGRKRDGEA